jgi:hypothetical protein
MKLAAVSLLLLGCATSADSRRRVFVAKVTVAVSDCARREAPRACPAADRLAALYFRSR